jgi:hypothetical protein
MIDKAVMFIYKITYRYYLITGAEMSFDIDTYKVEYHQRVKSLTVDEARVEGIDDRETLLESVEDHLDSVTIYRAYVRTLRLPRRPQSRRRRQGYRINF